MEPTKAHGALATRPDRWRHVPNAGVLRALLPRPDPLGRRAGEALDAAGSLRRLASQTEVEWRAAGLTAADCEVLGAALELAERLRQEALPMGQQFESPEQIFRHFHPLLRDEKRELFLVALLDARHRVLRHEVVSIGSLTSSIVHPREVFLPAIRESACAVVLVHNHPSGDARPSDEDVAVTGRLRRASEVLGIRILDHVVIGDAEYTSLREQGLL